MVDHQKKYKRLTKLIKFCLMINKEKNTMLKEHLVGLLTQHIIKDIVLKIMDNKIKKDNNSNNRIFTIEISIDSKHIIIESIKIHLKNFLGKVNKVMDNKDKEYIKYIEIGLVELIIKK